MKDVDRLTPRNRKLRGIGDQIGSTGLAISSLVALLFLGALVWQITAPTFIEGEQGEIPPSTEFIPISDYELKWDYPNVDSDGALTTEAIVLKLSWEDINGSHSHYLEVMVTPERGLSMDVDVDSDGVSHGQIEVGRKTKFYILSAIETPVRVSQISGPVPAADATGAPLVSAFVIENEIHILWDDGVVFEPLEMIAYLSLAAMIFFLSKPSEKVLIQMKRLTSYQRWIKPVSYILAVATYIAGSSFVSAFLGALCWVVVGRVLAGMVQGIERMLYSGRHLNETSRLRHSISNRDGLLLSAKMLFISSTVFIPLFIEIPFLTERYQDIFSPYSSGIRAAFYGTIWVMLIAMLVSVPLSVGAAIYLEEYASPTRMTKLIQALVTNLAGVPSIVFGMFGLAIFVKQGGIGWGLGPSILAAGLTMGVMAMPIVVLGSREALRSVPRTIRESAYGVGCTQWQVTRDHVLPSAMPGIMTGTILAMSRIMGEAAPLVVIGASAMVLFDPEPLAGLLGGDKVNFTVIPIQIYFWTAEPSGAWHSMAAAASISLIFLLVTMNSVAIILRQHFRKRLSR